MPTVAELVEDVAKIMSMRPETVNAYARALIDYGLLPKSRGRAVAMVTPCDVSRLFMAVCLEPKIKDAGETVERYGMMKGAGVPETAPLCLQEELDGYLAGIVFRIFEYPSPNEDKQIRQSLVNSEITFVRNWDEVEISTTLDDKRVFRRFKASGTSPSNWEGYHKSTTVLSCKAFAMLGIGEDHSYFFKSPTDKFEQEEVEK